MLKAVACTMFFVAAASSCLAQDDELPLVNATGTVISDLGSALSLDITAPVTELKRGETGTVEITVRGLSGLEAPLFLHLVNGAPEIVGLDGGDTQTLEIQPADVTADGTFVAKAVVNARRSGKFAISAQLLDRLPALLAKPSKHVPNVSDPPHATTVTYAPTHYWRATWPPHLAEVSWPHHTTGDSFTTPHTALVTFGPKGQEHQPATTWPHVQNVTKWQHYAGVSYGIEHHHRVTWPPHVAGISWGPGRHNVATTYEPHRALQSWPHILEATWRPHAASDSWNSIAPDHKRGTTWPPQHVAEVTWPPGHIATGTWPPHTASTTWPSEHSVTGTWPPHVAKLTFPPAPSHAVDQTWPGSTDHTAGQTWAPHFAKVTWAREHKAGITWPDKHGRDTWPPTESHVAGQTWPPHSRSVTWPPHFTTGTWPEHSNGTTFPPNHDAGVSWPRHVQPTTWQPAVNP